MHIIEIMLLVEERQVYRSDAGGDSADTESDSDAESRPPKPKKKRLTKKNACQPLIIVACTPLMARVHINIK